MIIQIANPQSKFNPYNAMKAYEGIELFANSTDWLPLLGLSGASLDHNGLSEHHVMGLGDAATESQIVNTSAIGGSSTASVLAATGIIAGSTAAIAIPVIGAVAAAIIFWLNRKGPQQKVETTKIVDAAEPILKQNLLVWNQSTKTRSIQLQMLANFDAVWARIVQLCSDSRYGDPGHNCISDRQAGGKWDWFAYYRNPIADDPNVVADSSAGGAIVDSAVGASSIVSSLVHGVTGVDIGIGGAMLAIGAIALVVALD